jgi:hypothetical protein
MKQVSRRLVVFSMVLFHPALAGADPVQESFDSGLGAWTGAGLWDVTTARYSSPPQCATDSPGRFYLNDSDTSLTRAAPIDLSAAVHPVLVFRHQYMLEEGYDFARVEVSVNGGVDWTVLAVYTGARTEWTREQLSLSAQAGQGSVLLRFRVVTDASVVMDGWYVDDVRVTEAPAAPSGLTAAAASPNRLHLAWTPSGAPAGTGQRILRASTPGVDWRTAHMVADLPPDASTFDDITVAPKSGLPITGSCCSTTRTRTPFPTRPPPPRPPGWITPFSTTRRRGR